MGYPRLIAVIGKTGIEEAPDAGCSPLDVEVLDRAPSTPNAVAMTKAETRTWSFVNIGGFLLDLEAPVLGCGEGIVCDRANVNAEA